MNKRRILVFLVVTLFTLYSFIKVFPLDIGKIKKMYFLGFNAHHFIYAKKTAENISNLSLTSQDFRLNDGYISSYYNDPSAFWLALLFVFVPEQYHKSLYGFVNMFLFLSLIFFILIISKSFKNMEIFILILIPYAISRNIRWMPGGDIIGHSLPSIFFIYAWKKLKDFLLTQNSKDIIICSIFSALSIFCNLTFAFPLVTLWALYLPKVVKKIGLIAVIHSLIAPFILVYIYQFSKYLIPIVQISDVLEKMLFGEDHIKKFLDVIKFNILTNPLIPFCIIYVFYRFIKLKLSEDIIFSSIFILLFLFSHYVPNNLIRALFFYKFEFITFFISSVHLISEINGKFRKLLLYLVGITSYIFIFFLTLSPFPNFANFKYEEYEKLISDINQIVKNDKIMIETSVITKVTTEEVGIVYGETDAKVFGHIWSSPSNFIFSNGFIIFIDIDDKERIVFDVIKERKKFKKFIEEKGIKYILCQSEKCLSSLSDTCEVSKRFEIAYSILEKNYILFVCNNLTNMQ